MNPELISDLVGPVLQQCPLGDAVAMVIQELNPGARIVHRGSYLRVLSHKRCVLTRGAMESRLGKEFRMLNDLEPIMPSFKGQLSVTDEQITWERGEP